MESEVQGQTNKPLVETLTVLAETCIKSFEATGHPARGSVSNETMKVRIVVTKAPKKRGNS